MQASGHPYGIWHALYQPWANFVEGIWPLLEEAFQGSLALTDELLDEKWNTFLKTWDEDFQAVLRTWLTYPLLRAQGDWVRDLFAWRARMLEFRWLIGTFADPDMRVVEVWPDLKAWFLVFRPWGEQVQAYAEVLRDLPHAPGDTALWHRYLQFGSVLRDWEQRVLTPLVHLQRRVRVFGREWPEAVRHRWLQWTEQAYLWTVRWLDGWVRWFTLPLLE